MKLEGISLSEDLSEKLFAVLDARGRDETVQELAEELLKKEILYQWKKVMNTR